MYSMLILSPGELPVPAVKGGAVETLISALIDENEKAGRCRLDVFSVSDPALMASGGKNWDLLQVRAKRLSALADRFSFWFMEYIRNDWRAMFYRNRRKKRDYLHAVSRHLASHRYDVVLVENEPALLAVALHALGKAEFSQKCLYHMHSVLIPDPGTVPLLQQCRGILSVSDYVTCSVRKQWPVLQQTPFYTVKNGVSLANFHRKNDSRRTQQLRKALGISAQEYVFLYAGRLSQEKGVRELLLAFEQLSRENVCLIIAGGSYSGAAQSSRYEARLKDYVCRRNLRVVFTGFIPNEAMADYYEASDALVIPSLVPEAGSVTSLEAVAMGIPVLASRIGSLPEYLGDRAIYAEPGERFVSELAQKMQFFCDRQIRYPAVPAMAAVPEELSHSAFYARFMGAVEQAMEGLS